jgi:hypothetical protein
MAQICGGGTPSLSRRATITLWTSPAFFRLPTACATMSNSFAVRWGAIGPATTNWRTATDTMASECQQLGFGRTATERTYTVRSLLREHRSQACPTTKRIETNFLETGRCEKKAPLPPDSKLKIGHRSLQELSGAFFSHRHPTSPSSTLKSRGRRGGLFFRTNRYPIWRSALLTMVANTH